MRFSWKMTFLIGLIAAGIAVYFCCPQTVMEASGYLQQAKAKVESGLRLAEAKLKQSTERLWDQRQSALSGKSDAPVATPAPAAPPRRILLWHDAESMPRRGKVEAGETNEFLAALRRSFDEDRGRLQALAAEHLNVEMETVFSQQFLRLPAFLDEVFAYGSTASLLYAAVASTGGVVEPNDRKTAIAKVQEDIGKKLVERYRETVLSPHSVIAPARTAAGRAHASLRRDLLANCDRYDRAFQSFLRQHAREVEVLDSPAGWRPDPAWSPDKAGFRSLCHTIRLADGGLYSIDEKAFSELTEPDMTVREIFNNLTLPLAEAAVDVAQSTASAMHALSGIGLPESIAYWPAAAFGLTRSSLTLSWYLLDHLNPAENRPRLDTHLRETLRQSRAEVMRKIQDDMAAFAASRLDGIESAIVARSPDQKAGR